MTGWKPMATAPREIGRPLLLYPRPKAPMASYSAVFEGYWDGKDWRTASGIVCFPTAWMPMPGPPLMVVKPRE